MEDITTAAFAALLVTCLVIIAGLMIEVIVTLVKSKYRKKAHTEAFSRPYNPIFGKLTITVDTENKTLYPFLEFDSEKSAHDLLTAKEATFKVEIVNSDLRRKNNL